MRSSWYQVSGIDKNTVIVPDLRHYQSGCVPEIRYKDRVFVYTGDLIPTTAHIPLLWNMAYDLLPLVTIAEKQELLGEALEGNYILLFQHDPVAECCTLTETPKDIRAGVKGKLADYL